MFPRTLVQYDGVLASFLRVIPVMNLSVDLMPLLFAFDLCTVIEVQGLRSEVANPQDPRVLLVAMISMPLTR